MNRLKAKIKDRPVCILLHGRSLEELEKRITEIKNEKICWISLNAYDIVEKYILQKINKKLDIIYCGANYTPDIEVLRIPLLIQSLDKGAFLIAKRYLFTEVFPKFINIDLYKFYQKKILFLENVYNSNGKSLFEVLSTHTVSSLGYLLCALSIAGAKEIKLFGLDGCGEPPDDLLSTYYKPEIHRERRKKVTSIKSSIQSDTYIYNNKYYNTYLECMKEFNIEHIGLSVKEPVKMAEWYKNVLGFNIKRSSETDEFEKSVTFIADKDNRVMLELFKLSDISPLCDQTDHHLQLQDSHLVPPLCRKDQQS